QIWILGVIWTAMVILITIFQNYPSCTSNFDWLHDMLNILTAIFIIDTVIIFIFLFIQSRKVDRNINNNKNPLENTCISYHKDDIEHQDQLRVFIIPVYVMFLYAISKIIMMVVHGNLLSIEEYPSYIIWGFILYFSFRFWYRFKEYVDIEDRYSINYTLVIISWTLLAIFWEAIIPYIADVIKLTQCLIKNIAQLSHACGGIGI
ncbi:MAG: hypothetical protein U9N49_04340, partial [Campylobacterota bacterium]|nr:hypothetical protein [Campylobacterota bacterium]